MIAGRMKYKLMLLKPEVMRNKFGEATASYTEFRTIWAERVKASGSRSDEVGEHFPDFRAEFNIRDAHPVRENWRVRQLGGYEFNVVAVIPNLDRGMLTLICERVNP